MTPIDKTCYFQLIIIYDSSHLGVKRALEIVTAKYYWPGLTQDVKEYVKGYNYDGAIVNN